MPSTQDIVITLLPDSFQFTKGTLKPSSAFVVSLNLDAEELSSLKSNSLKTIPSKCSITSTGRKRLAKGAKKSTNPASK